MWVINSMIDSTVDAAVYNVVTNFQLGSDVAGFTTCGSLYGIAPPKADILTFLLQYDNFLAYSWIWRFYGECFYKYAKTAFECFRWHS